jgi:glucokinase-like ROK family protein
VARQFRTGDQTLVRELNRSILLQRLRVRPPLSRADLAAATGLNKTTVSKLIDELIADGLVHEIGLVPSGGGRPAVLLELKPDGGWIVGGEIGVGRMVTVVADLRATIAWRREATFEKDAGMELVLQRLDALLRQARQFAQRSSERRLLGVGVTVPGLVDVISGILVFEPNMGWRDVPLRDRLASKLHVPAFIENDANAAALAERYFGAAQDVEDFAYVVANIGLGAGLVVGGQIFSGASGYAGEAGHTTIDPDGPLCRCGNRGCWERLASLRALTERVDRALEAGLPSRIPSLAAGGEITLEVILEAARDGDQVARQALDETGTYLGIGIANLINLLNPQLVAFGGSLSLAHEFLMPAAQRVVDERAMRELRQAARIVVSPLRADACVLGGVALVLHDLLRRPHLVQRTPELLTADTIQSHHAALESMPLEGR